MCTPELFDLALGAGSYSGVFTVEVFLELLNVRAGPVDGLQATTQTRLIERVVATAPSSAVPSSAVSSSSPITAATAVTST